MKSIFFLLAIIPMLVLPMNVNASIVDYDNEPQEQLDCEERTDYDFLCSGSSGATGIPFCDKYNLTQRVEQFPNNTNPSHCLSREHNPIEFCEEFDDLTDTYKYCRNVPGSEEYFEYAKTGGPDQSCLFDVYQIKCQAFPNMNETARAECPEGFGTNEDDYCFPLHRTGCPEGYHDTDDDESGQCYPNDEECDGWDEIGGERFDLVLLTDRPDGKGDRCASLSSICDEGDPDSDHSRCEDFQEAVERQQAEYNRNLNQTQN